MRFMIQRRRDPKVTGSTFVDLVEAAEAERLSIQAGLAHALERAIRRFPKTWTQAEAAHRLGISQPRVNDLLRGRLDKFSIDALIVYLVRVGVRVRIYTSPLKRQRAGRVAEGER
jgi:predicted XRE-type DNA-binding protein